MSTQPPEGIRTGNMFPNRAEERVRRATGTSVEGIPAEEDIDESDLKERAKMDPEAEPNQTQDAPTERQ